MVYTLCSSLENHTRFQTKMGKVYTCFHSKTAQKPYPKGQHIPINMAYVRGYPPGFVYDGSKWESKVLLVCVHLHGLLFKILKQNNLADLKFPQEGSGKAGNQNRK